MMAPVSINAFAIELAESYWRDGELDSLRVGETESCRDGELERLMR